MNLWAYTLIPLKILDEVLDKELSADETIAITKHESYKRLLQKRDVTDRPVHQFIDGPFPVWYLRRCGHSKETLPASDQARVLLPSRIPGGRSRGSESSRL